MKLDPVLVVVNATSKVWWHDRIEYFDMDLYVGTLSSLNIVCEYCLYQKL